MRLLPAWFKQELPAEESRKRMRILSGSRINTVCQQAKCPNLNRCFKNRELTFLILGDACTRNCRFCAVAKAKGKSLKVDPNEAKRIARAVKALKLDYVVITSVTRDDLDDGGARQFALAIKQIRSFNKAIKIEVLIPDFQGRYESIKRIASALPSVIAHNLETVKRISLSLRPQADYQRSLDVLKIIKQINENLITKSSVMLGLGETEAEVVAVMEDLRYAKCDILTLGQYLSPSAQHHPVVEYIDIGNFRKYWDIGMALGFRAVLSAPLARSSYNAGQLYSEAIKTGAF